MDSDTKCNTLSNSKNYKKDNKKDNKKAKIDMRLPRGTQDYSGMKYLKMEYLQSIVKKIFSQHNGEYIETPVFEFTNILMNKYGEDEKLIYHLNSNSNFNPSSISDENTNKKENADLNLAPTFKESLSLRYDLTIPLVRYCIQNKIKKMRRCTIGKVYRRENISNVNQRLREFYQADFDFVGDYGELLSEISIFTMIQQLFSELKYDSYEIIYNYRQILDKIVEISGIQKSMFNTVCSSIDKLDKYDDEYVSAELMEKGITEDQIKLLFKHLHNTCDLNTDSNTDESVPEDIKIFDRKFRSCLSSMQNIDPTKIRFDKCLARGSDYYTGIIFEVKLLNSELKSSVAGGGRYDELMESYNNENKKNKNNKNNKIQMIGFSFGLDRLLNLVPDDAVKLDNANRPVWLAIIGDLTDPESDIKLGLDEVLKIKFKLISFLQKSGKKVLYNTAPRKFNKEIQDAEKENCSHVYILGNTEYSRNKIKVKDMDTRTETEVNIF